MIIIDTNVLSELMRPTPTQSVINWFDQTNASELYTTAITYAEINFGLAILPAGKRRNTLQKIFESIFLDYFNNKVLAFDYKASKLYGPMAALYQQAGKAVGQADIQIACIAKQHNSSLSTRNSSDFELSNIKLINPFLH